MGVADAAFPFALGVPLIHIVRFFVLAFEVGLTALVIHRFQIGGTEIMDTTWVVFGGFVIHSLLPFAYRLPFFVLLSMTSIAVVLGLEGGLWLIAVGGALIGICHLSSSNRINTLILLSVAAALTAGRAGWLPAPWPHLVWPVLGSMFMFRLIVYLYDLRHDRSHTTIWRTFSYFFLLPNACVPLFPVIDYKAFRRGHYGAEPHTIYQTGVDWMLRGIVHLLAYRIVYYFFVLSPSEVETAGDLLQFLLANFALYLRVSGIFHLVVGMLHLFGFSLPRTHDHYFLAESVNDFWRRINIYWKDFMLKIFFYPAFFRLRAYGVPTALVLSTIYVASATWLLHSYQAFWVTGQFPLRWQDGAFWGSLGVLMIGNSLYENYYPQARGPRTRAWSFGRAFRVVITFSLICILWSLWTCESFADWLAVWSVLWEARASTTLRSVSPWIFGVLLVSAVVAFGPRGSRTSGGLPTSKLGPGGSRTFLRSVGITSAALAFLLLVSHSRTHRLFRPEVRDVMRSLQRAGLNRLDAEKLQRGYYEDILSSSTLFDRVATEMAELTAKQPPTGSARQRGQPVEPWSTSFSRPRSFGAKA
jgi:hypothetical protein